LRELDWIESRTIAIEYRWAEGGDERYRIGADVTGGRARGSTRMDQLAKLGRVGPGQ
jgi:hypothetical protein